MDTKYFAQPWNMGAFLHYQQLAVVPGTFSQVITEDGIITICEAVPYDPTNKDRPRFTFWSYKKPNSAGELVEFLSSMAEEKLPQTNAGFYSQPSISTNVIFKT